MVFDNKMKIFGFILVFAFASLFLMNSVFGINRCSQYLNDKSYLLPNDGCLGTFNEYYGNTFEAKSLYTANYPWGTATRLSFSLPDNSAVVLDIYNYLGSGEYAYIQYREAGSNSWGLANSEFAFSNNMNTFVTYNGKNILKVSASAINSDSFNVTFAPASEILQKLNSNLISCNSFQLSQDRPTCLLNTTDKGILIPVNISTPQPLNNNLSLDYSQITANNLPVTNYPTTFITRTEGTNTIFCLGDKDIYQITKVNATEVLKYLNTPNPNCYKKSNCKLVTTISNNQKYDCDNTQQYLDLGITKDGIYSCEDAYYKFEKNVVTGCKLKSEFADCRLVDTLTLSYYNKKYSNKQYGKDLFSYDGQKYKVDNNQLKLKIYSVEGGDEGKTIDTPICSKDVSLETGKYICRDNFSGANKICIKMISKTVYDVYALKTNPAEAKKSADEGGDGAGDGSGTGVKKEPTGKAGKGWAPVIDSVLDGI